MLTRTTVIAQEQVIRSDEAAHVDPKRPLLVSVMLAVVFISTVLIVGVMTTARIQPSPTLPDLPQIYLPGNPIPTDMTCYTSSDEHFPRCSVRIEQNSIYFGFDLDQKTISGTLIPAREYTIGQLVSAWGRPSGITRKETMVYVHWGARSALMYTRDFRPGNPVEFILYDLESLPASPWRGYRLFE